MNNFSSRENKKNMWEFMQKNKFFNNLPDENSSRVQDHFESSIQSILTTNNTDNVVALNKKLIHTMYEFIKTLPKNKEVRFETNEYVGKDTNVLTAEEESKKRQDEFHMRLNSRQNEFNNMMTRNIPKEIDFSDNSRETQIKNMEEQIERTVNERAKELNHIYSANTVKDDSNKRKRLEIKEDCTIFSRDIEHIVSRKYARAESETFKDMETIHNNISSLEEKVKKILTAQEKILSLINKKTSGAINESDDSNQTETNHPDNTNHSSNTNNSDIDN